MVEALREEALLGELEVLELLRRLGIDTSHLQQEGSPSVCRICPGITCMNLDGPSSGRHVIKDGKIVPPPKKGFWDNINRCEIKDLGRILGEPFILPPPAAYSKPCSARHCSWRFNFQGLVRP